MSKYVKIYNEQGLPLGFKGYSNVSSAIGDANVKLYDDKGRLVGVSASGEGGALMPYFKAPYILSYETSEGDTLSGATIVATTPDLIINIPANGDNELRFLYIHANMGEKEINPEAPFDHRTDDFLSFDEVLQEGDGEGVENYISLSIEGEIKNGDTARIRLYDDTGWVEVRVGS